MSSEGTRVAPRNPWFAAAFSLLAIGVGHVYCGRIGLALALFSYWFVYFPMFALLAWLEPSRGLLLTLLAIPVLLHFPLYLGAALHAFILARGAVKFEMKDYNRGAIYVVLVVLGLTYPLLIATTVRNHFFEAYVIPTNSMAPTIVSGDRLLCNRGRYNWDPIRRGDLVVFHPPGTAGKFRFVKRVIGVGGDTVQVRNGRVWLNGEKLAYGVPDDVSAIDILKTIRAQAEVQTETIGGRRYVIGADSGESPLPDWGPAKIATGKLFVLGDLRPQSKDSRAFGPIQVTDVIGRLEYRYYSAASWSNFGVVQ